MSRQEDTARIQGWQSETGSHSRAAGSAQPPLKLTTATCSQRWSRSGQTKGPPESPWKTQEEQTDPGCAQAKADFGEHRDREGLDAGLGRGHTGKLSGAPGGQVGAPSLICPVGSPVEQLYLPLFCFFEASEAQKG